MLPINQGVRCKRFERNTLKHLEGTDINVKRTYLYCLSIVYLSVHVAYLQVRVKVTLKVTNKKCLSNKNSYMRMLNIK